MRVRSRANHKLPVSSVLKRTPGAEAALLDIELMRKVNVGLAVEQVAQVKAGSLKMYGIDLEVTPVQAAVSVVVVNVALTLWILSTLNC